MSAPTRLAGSPRAAPRDGELLKPAGRATCWRCHKPAALCLCARVPSVENRTHVHVLRHRHERDHAVGTARLARLGLSTLTLQDVVGAVPRPALRPRAALLSPGPDARDLTELASHERPEQLVVLDGTWRHAHALLRDNPWLRELPRVALHPEHPSRYRIRRQPAPECLSTIESVVLALRHLEPGLEGLDGLLAAFDGMVAEQQAFAQAPDVSPRFQRKRPRASRAVPPEILADEGARLVAIYGETAPGAGARRRLVRLAALRPASGETLDLVLRPSGEPPRAGHLAHMGLSPADVAGGLPHERARQAWRAFLRDDDVLVAWHPWAGAMLRAFDAGAPTVHALKIAWSNVHHRRCGGLQELAVEQALVPEPCGLPGRAARRLGLAAAVALRLVATAPRVAHVEG